MDVINARPDLVGVTVLFERVEELHVALGSFDGDDVGIEALDGREDVVEIRVAKVRVGLEGIGDTCSRQLEGVNRPLEVSVPVSTTKRQLWRHTSISLTDT